MADFFSETMKVRGSWMTFQSATRKISLSTKKSVTGKAILEKLRGN